MKSKYIYVGIDNGVSGEIVVRFENGEWVVYRVVVTRYKDHRVLDALGNLAFLESIATRAGGRHRLFVVYEQSRKNNGWGTNNSFANGQNNEFWRVLLTLEKFQFDCVDPLTWQALCHKGIKRGTSKQKSLKYVRAHCPDLKWLKKYNKAERLGIVDAMCIAFWSSAVKIGEQPEITVPDQVAPEDSQGN
jgi:hypothetical protein